MRFLLHLAMATIAFLSADMRASADDAPIVIGAMYNLTGGQQDLDKPSADGARLAVDLVNAGEGLLGRQVAMMLVDGKTKPDTIRAEARRLFRDTPTLAGLIGFSDTDMVLAAASIAAEHGRLFLTSGATSPLLPEEVPEYLFLTCFGDNVQAAAGAEWTYDALQARTVAVLFNEEATYTRLLHGYFETRFKQLGGKVLAVEPYSGNATDFGEKARMLPRADLVYLAALPDDIGFAVPALRAAGIEAPIFGGDGLDIGEAWAKVDDARKVFFTTHAYLGADNPDPEVRAFRAAFAKAYPGETPSAFAALGYDAARLLMDAIERAGGTDPQAVRDALARTKDFAGVTGTIGFAEDSRIPLKSVTIMGVDGGKQAFEASILPSEAPPPR